MGWFLLSRLVAIIGIKNGLVFIIKHTDEIKRRKERKWWLDIWDQTFLTEDFEDLHPLFKLNWIKKGLSGDHKSFLWNFSWSWRTRIWSLWTEAVCFCCLWDQFYFRFFVNVNKSSWSLIEKINKDLQDNKVQERILN